MFKNSYHFCHNKIFLTKYSYIVTKIIVTILTFYSSDRSRRHRLEILNKVENEIGRAIWNRKEEEDVHYWRSAEDKFKQKFTTKETWNQIRTVHVTQEWYRAVWFKHTTPKFFFFAWLAFLNRLSTWNGTSCWNTRHNIFSLCVQSAESRDHLFSPAITHLKFGRI